MSEATTLVRISTFDAYGTVIQGGHAFEERRVYHAIVQFAVTAGDPGLSKLCVTHVPTGLRMPMSGTECEEYARRVCDAFAVVFAATSYRDGALFVAKTADDGVTVWVQATLAEFQSLLSEVYALAKRGEEAAA